MKHNKIFNRIKSDFCHLFEFKIHGNTLEVITPLATVTNKFVSVFITERKDSLIVTDGGWVEQEIYGHKLLSDHRDIILMVISQFKKHYHIKQTCKDEDVYYFRSVKDLNLLSSAVFDIANFTVGVVNSYSLEYKEQKEKEERDKFRSETNAFFKKHYNKGFKINYELARGLRFNGVLTVNNEIHLFQYITGSTTTYYNNDIRKAIVNFNLLEEVYIPERKYIANKISIYNNSAFAHEDASLTLKEYLKKLTTTTFDRSEQGEIISLINPN